VGAVTRTAQQDQVGEVVAASERARHDVMDVEPERRPTAGHAAAAVIAPPHLAIHGRRDVLASAGRLGRLDRADVLGVALGQLDRGGRDRDRRAGGVLPACPAIWGCARPLDSPSRTAEVNAAISYSSSR
jgi:hypothetical protein